MVHKNASEGSRGRPRGKPFKKSDQGEAKNDILRPARRSSGAKRGVVKKEEKKEPDVIVHDIVLPPIAEVPTLTQYQPDTKGKELIEEMKFDDGTNFISIKLFKRNNRMFRIQIFLNDAEEIRPMTFSGATMANAYWKLLKGAVKK